MGAPPSGCTDASSGGESGYWEVEPAQEPRLDIGRQLHRRFIKRIVERDRFRQRVEDHPAIGAAGQVQLQIVTQLGGQFTIDIGVELPQQLLAARNVLVVMRVRQDSSPSAAR